MTVTDSLDGGVAPPRARVKWLAPGAGSHYARGRWRSPRRAGRDPALVEEILERHGVRASRGGVLDAPSGTGRLRDAIERGRSRASGDGTAPGGYTGIDVSASMLAEARRSGTRRLLRGDLERLPFPDDCFDVVVACRILHHFHDERDLARAAAEIVRVSSRLIVASFWDGHALPALLRRLGLSRRERPRGRTARSRGAMARVFREAGATVLEFRHSFRFLSQQTFLVAEKRKEGPSGTPRD